ncbi:hypothetical protein RRG08_066514 [Elysia crispata]|uniref:Uncharacterized protein n=1 Tax=Elysia crispata TaxID=231223 RepID=A0AAE0ZLX9_9GAST|nr:hypothetical protein RRG08_066514 [Elysia crispata]
MQEKDSCEACSAVTSTTGSNCISVEEAWNLALIAEPSLAESNTRGSTSIQAVQDSENYNSLNSAILQEVLQFKQYETRGSTTLQSMQDSKKYFNSSSPILGEVLQLKQCKTRRITTIKTVQYSKKYYSSISPRLGEVQ